MKTYTCDMCFHEEKFTSGIVGSEYEHLGVDNAIRKLTSRRFHTLTPKFRRDGIVDVCSVCYKQISDAHFRSKLDIETSVMKRFWLRLDEMKASLSP